MKHKLLASGLLAISTSVMALSELPVETLDITVTKEDVARGVRVPTQSWEDTVLRIDPDATTIFPERATLAPLTFAQARKAIKRRLNVKRLGFLFLERKGRCKVSGSGIVTYGGIKKPRKVRVRVKCKPAKKKK